MDWGGCQFLICGGIDLDPAFMGWAGIGDENLTREDLYAAGSAPTVTGADVATPTSGAL